MHRVWIGAVCVRLEERFSYSNTLGWNTFPIPRLSVEQKEILNSSARKIILARERHYPKTIAELYDPEKMPNDLKEVHQNNDLVLEKFYRNEPFQNDEERLEYLFQRYVEMTQGGGE